jgi:hypothetical protein
MGSKRVPGTKTDWGLADWPSVTNSTGLDLTCWVRNEVTFRLSSAPRKKLGPVEQSFTKFDIWEFKKKSCFGLFLFAVELGMKKNPFQRTCRPFCTYLGNDLSEGGTERSWSVKLKVWRRLNKIAWTSFLRLKIWRRYMQYRYWTVNTREEFREVSFSQ